MATSDGVTLENCADDYGRRCKSIGLERRSVADLQDAMDHPDFKKRQHRLLDELAKARRAMRMFKVVRKVDLPELPEFCPADELRLFMLNDKCAIRMWVIPDEGGFGAGDTLHSLIRRAGAEQPRDPAVLTIRRTLMVATLRDMVLALPKSTKRLSFGQVFVMVARQGWGQEGDLLVHGEHNFFLVEGTDQVLSLRWDSYWDLWGFQLFRTTRDLPSSAGRVQDIPEFQFKTGSQFITCDPE